jgi:hypothetical protein
LRAKIVDEETNKLLDTSARLWSDDFGNDGAGGADLSHVAPHHHDFVRSDRPSSSLPQPEITEIESAASAG